MTETIINLIIHNTKMWLFFFFIKFNTHFFLESPKFDQKNNIYKLLIFCLFKYLTYSYITRFMEAFFNE